MNGALLRSCAHHTIINLQVGQGLSKDAKARKLAFQHWIEAVRTFLFSCFTCNHNLLDAWLDRTFSFLMQILFEILILIAVCFSRLIRGTGMGTAYIFTMRNGVKPILASPSSTGEWESVVVFRVLQGWSVVFIFQSIRISYLIFPFLWLLYLMRSNT